VVFDDFTGGWMPYHNLLELTDAYECLVQSKGGVLQFSPCVIAFTSNYPPTEWYRDANIIYGALDRRIDVQFEHRRVDANFDGPPGLVPGDIVIEVKRGLIQYHPLYDLLEPTAKPEIFRFPTANQMTITSTLAAPDTMEDFWQSQLQVDDELSDELSSGSLSIMEISSDSEEYSDDDSSLELLETPSPKRNKI
jgi:hypothetical protein